MVSKTPPRLLGLCSPCMGSGKTEVAKRLCTLRGKPMFLSGAGPWQQVKFAQPLKAMADTLLGCAGVPMLSRTRMLDGDMKETPIASLGGITPRRIMQTLGTEWGRNTLGEDFWVNATMPIVDGLLQQGYSVVIDDLRFTNEADAITERGGVLIRINRPDAQPYAAHASEGELDGWAMPEIFNGGTLAQLHEQADRLARGELY